MGLVTYSYQEGSGENIGIYNKLGNKGTGQKMGMYTLLGDSYSYGTQNDIFGSYIELNHRYADNAYGLYLDLIRPSYTSLSDPLYGVYVNVQGETRNVTGIYSAVSGDDAWAAKFVGRVEVNEVFVNSDAQLKQDIDSISNALEIIEKMKPKAYKFRGGNRFGYNSKDQHYGFLAQDLESILPGLVKNVKHAESIDYPEIDVSYEHPDSTGTHHSSNSPVANNGASNQRKKVVHPAEEVKAVNYIDLIPILAQAIKDQQRQIKALSSKDEKIKTALSEKSKDNNAVAKLRDELAQMRDSSTMLVKTVVQLQAVNTELTVHYEMLANELKDLRQELADLRECTDCYAKESPQRLLIPSSKLTIYPNPADNQITVRYTETREYTVKILTNTGKLIGTQQATDYVTRLDVSTLPAGSYTIELSQGEQLIDQQLLIIK